MTTPPKLSPEAASSVEKAVRRIATPKDAPYFRHLLTELVLNKVIPASLLSDVPVPAAKAGKTRFDQLYDAAMGLVFPGYRKTTLERLLGPAAPDEGEGDRIWRVLLPERFRLVHVLIRASTFQEAFSLGCDYACRASLRIFGRVPTDLTVRVVYVSERAIRRMLDIRGANKVNKRRHLNLVGREFTAKQVNGARLLALGSPKDPSHSVVKYAEVRDMDAVRDAGIVRSSRVEQESHRRRPEPPGPAD